ncbi:MAG: hypothetical protein ABI885_21015 [Gammaproteobacteria bacterium]
MKASLGQLRPLTGLLMVVCFGIMLTLMKCIWQRTQTDALLRTPARAYTLPSVTLELPQKGSGLEPIRDNALFYASRSFFVAPPPGAAPVTPPKPDYLLAGTLIIPRKPTVALLQQRAGGAVRKVRPGDDLEGWTVRSVENRTVVLMFGEEHMEIVSVARSARQGIVAMPVSRGARGGAPNPSTNPSSPPETVAVPATVRTLGKGGNTERALREASAGGQALNDARLYVPPQQ